MIVRTPRLGRSALTPEQTDVERAVTDAAAPARREPDLSGEDFEHSAADWKRPLDQSTELSLGGQRVKVAWREFGNPEAKDVVVCVHGFTRNSSDFDFLGGEMGSADRRVISVNVVGRGKSASLKGAGKAKDYAFPTYADQMSQLFQEWKLAKKDVTWIGTSMGGVIGMKMAGLPNSPISRLILNDVGPEISPAAFRYLAASFKGDKDLVFRNLDQATAYFRERMHGFGELSDEQWRHLAEGSVAWDKKRKGYVVAYDPAITKTFRQLGQLGPLMTPAHWKALSLAASREQWQSWKKVKVPVLVLHGEDSAVLTQPVIDRMVASKPKGQVSVHHFADVGHAPPLASPAELAVLERFKASTPVGEKLRAAGTGAPGALRGALPRLPLLPTVNTLRNATKLSLALPRTLMDAQLRNHAAASHGSRPRGAGEALFEVSDGALWGTYNTTKVGGRNVHWQVPDGKPPRGGWKVALLLSGTGASPQAFFHGRPGGAWGMGVQPRITKALLEQGFAVLAPETGLGKNTAFDSNTPLGLLGANSPDNRFLTKLFAEIDGGTLGKLNGKDLAAVGLSSGGYAASSLLSRFPERFTRGAVIASAGHYQATPLDAYVPRSLSPDHPRVLFLHGGEDAIVDARQPSAYAKALRAAGVEAKLVVQEKAGHGWTEEAPQLTTDFLSDS